MYFGWFLIIAVATELVPREKVTTTTTTTTTKKLSYKTRPRDSKTGMYIISLIIYNCFNLFIMNSIVPDEVPSSYTKINGDNSDPGE